MQQLFIINPTAGKTDASVVLVPQITTLLPALVNG